MSEQEMAKEMQAYAARLLAPREGVRYLTRPRFLSLGMLVVMAAVVLGLVVFSIVVEPGFIQLLNLPAIPLLGGLIASLTHSPVIFVTDRRIVFARRFLKPLSLDLKRLSAIRVQQNSLERLLGYGELLLLFHPPPKTLAKGSSASLRSPNFLMQPLSARQYLRLPMPSKMARRWKDRGFN